MPGLVLQLRIIVGFTSMVVAALCKGLVPTPPERPGDCPLGIIETWPDNSNQETFDFWYSQRNQISPLFCCADSFTPARRTARNTSTSIESVMCRYQPVHERTS